MPNFLPTTRQREFLEHADWLLDTHVGRGTGRTHVMAMSAIKLAIRGHVVHLYDPSLVLCDGVSFEQHSHFRRQVMACIEMYYPDQEFQFSMIGNTVIYMGPRTLVNPAPVFDLGPDMEDDGSDENA